MKRILQALDGASTKPVEGANDMAKFLSVIAKNDVKVIKEEQNNNRVLSEGANPHKVTLPVQMAMQHYQKPQAEKKKRPALIDKYFHQVQDEQLQERQEKRQLINQYASTIAQRVLMKEGKGEGQWHTSPSGARTNMPPTDDDYEINYGADGAAAAQNQPDAITMDVPLLIRLLEYAREDAQTDMDLHSVAENLINLSKTGETLSMDDYDSIVAAPTVSETKTIKPKRKSDPCWAGYHQVGVKNKENKVVPNCTKKNSLKSSGK